MVRSGTEKRTTTFLKKQMKTGFCLLCLILATKRHYWLNSVNGQHLLLRRPQQQGPRPPATSSAAASFSAAATNRPSAPPTDTTAGAGAAAAATSGRRGRWRGPPALRRGPGRADRGRSEPRGQATGTPEAAPGSAGPRTRSPRFVIVDSGLVRLHILR